MSGELTSYFRVQLSGANELEQWFSKTGSSAKGFTRNLNSTLTEAGRDITRFAASTARALGSLGGIGAGIGIAAQAKNVLDLREAIAGVAATAGLGEDSLEGLRRQVLEVSTASNQMATDVASALDAFVAKTGDIDTGRKYLELYGKVATATGSKISEIAAIGADLDKLKIKDQAEAMAIFAKQSDIGAVNLRDLVSQGPRLLAAFAGAGLTGAEGLRHGGALAQVFQKSTGNVERTSTSVEATFRDIAERADAIEGAGIKVKGRDRTDVLKDIIRKAKGDEFILRRIKGNGVFGDEAFRGISAMAREFRETGGFATFDKFANVAADNSVLDRQFAMRNNTPAAKLRSAMNKITASADKNFGGLLSDAAGPLAGGVADAFDFATGNPLLAGAGFFGLKAGGKMLGGLASRAAGGGIGGMGAGLGMPVTVTNWPASMGGGLGIPGGTPGAGGAARELGLLQLALQNVVPLMAALGVGLAAGGWLNKKLGLDKPTDKNTADRDADIEADPNARRARIHDEAVRQAKKLKAGGTSARKASTGLQGLARNLEGGNLSASSLELIEQLGAGDADSVLSGAHRTSDLPLLPSAARNDFNAGSIQGLDGAKPIENLNITINGDDVKIDGLVSTQHPKVRARRGAAE